MFSALKEFFDAWKQLEAFKKQPQEYRTFSVYSEGQQDWPHMGPILEQFLQDNPKTHLSFLSSDRKDPGLQFQHERFHAFYIGSGTVRTILFRSIDAKVFLMTLPDLNVYQLKKSVFPVHYAYCFHSICSAHTVYREHAFEHFDTFLCVGPHHITELRKEESLKGLKPRVLLEGGSIKLDTLMRQYAEFRRTVLNPEKPVILLAPSWGEGSFAEKPALIREMIQSIVDQKLECRLRLHPMTVRHHPQLIAQLRKDFAPAVQAKLFAIEDNLNNNTSLRDAHVMVSDWSGAATEFAFALERPVLFMNTPQKLNNPKWESYALPALEASLRTELGLVLEVNEGSKIASAIRTLLQEQTRFRDQIVQARKTWIFNEGRAAEVSAQHLSKLLNAAESHASAPAPTLNAEAP